jgi:hypothetical protein
MNKFLYKWRDIVIAFIFNCRYVSCKMLDYYECLNLAIGFKLQESSPCDVVGLNLELNPDIANTQHFHVNCPKPTANGH